MPVHGCFMLTLNSNNATGKMHHAAHPEHSFLLRNCMFLERAVAVSVT